MWGLHNPKSKQLIINARSETVTEKPMFRDAFLHRRCAVPSAGFYEWQKKSGQKYRFSLPEDSVFYFAGLFNISDGVGHFVILTTEANESVSPIHNRMPLILTEQTYQTWLFDQKEAFRILETKSPKIFDIQCKEAETNPTFFDHLA